MTAITVTADQIDVLGGRVPALGSSITLAPFSPLFRLGKITTTAPSTLPLVGGVGTLTVEPSPVGTAYRLTPVNLPGLAKTYTVAVPNLPTMTLVELLTAYQVDPRTLAPLAEPDAAWSLALRQVDSRSESALDAAEEALETADSAHALATTAGTRITTVDSRVTGVAARVTTLETATPPASTTPTSRVDQAGVDRLFASLDMRDPRALNVYVVSDSTGVPPLAWTEASWKAIMAAVYPERQAGVIRWNDTLQKLDPFLEWQSGTGGTQVRSKIRVLEENFSGVNAEIVGTAPTPTGGSAWQGATGQYGRQFTASAFMEPQAGRTADLSKIVYVQPLAHDLDAESEVRFTLRLSTNSAAQQTTRVWPLRRSNEDGTRFEVVASSAGTSVTVFARTNSVTRTLGNITNVPIPLNTPNNIVYVTHTITKDAANAGAGFLTVLVGSQTATFPLTAADMTSWANADQFAAASTDPTFRLANLFMDAYKTTTQAPTGGEILPPLTVYNLSVAGKTDQYQLDRLAAMFPTTAPPDLVMMGHGMNYDADTPAQYLTRFGTFRTAVRSRFTGAVPFWYVSPNIRIVGEAGVPSYSVPAHRARCVALREWAGLTDAPYSGVYERYAQRTDLGASWLLDFKHPNATGNAAGTEAVRADLRARSERL
jgi:hypothetical protein